MQCHGFYRSNIYISSSDSLHSSRLLCDCRLTVVLRCLMGYNSTVDRTPLCHLPLSGLLHFSKQRAIIYSVKPQLSYSWHISLSHTLYPGLQQILLVLSLGYVLNPRTFHHPHSWLTVLPTMFFPLSWVIVLLYLVALFHVCPLQPRPYQPVIFLKFKWEPIIPLL